MACVSPARSGSKRKQSTAAMALLFQTECGCHNRLFSLNFLHMSSECQVVSSVHKIPCRSARQLIVSWQTYLLCILFLGF